VSRAAGQTPPPRPPRRGLPWGRPAHRRGPRPPSQIAEEEGLTIEALLATKITGKKFDYKEKINQALPLVKRMKACVRHLVDLAAVAGEREAALSARHQEEALELQARAEGFERQHRETEELLVAAQSRLNEAREDLEGLVAASEGLAEQKRALEAELAAKAGEAERAGAEVGRLEREAASAAAQLAQAREQAAQAQRTAAQAQAVAAAAGEQGSRLEEQERRAQERVRELQDAQAALSKDVAEAAARQAALAGEVESLRGRLAEAEAGRRSAEAATAEAQGAARELERKLEGAREQGHAQRARHEEEAARLSRDVAALRAEVAASRAEAAGLRGEGDGLRGRALAAEERARERGEEAARAEREREAALAQVADLVDREVSLREGLTRAKAEQQELQRAARDVERARDGLQGRLDAAHAELERWQGMYREVEEQLVALREKRAELQGRSGDQAQMIDNLRQEVEALTKQSTMNRQQAARHEEDAGSLARRNDELAAQVESLRRSLQEAEAVRKRMHNTIQDLRGNIRVYCRVRPHAVGSVAGADGDAGAPPAVGFFEDLERRDSAVSLTYERNDREQQHQFAFDRVFRPGSTQEDVFGEISQLVQSALDGYRVCIFAYGQTGSGKTHTMMGSEGDPGMIPRAMAQVFEHGEQLREQGWEYKMRVSMVEIYNEEYRDLLSAGGGAGKIEVQHDEFEKDTSLTNCAVVDVRGADHVQDLVARAMGARSVAATAMNAQSSRSHSVFILWIEGRNDELGQQFRSSLNMVDLAGSERLKSSKAEGERKDEAVAINSSLSAIKTCFQQMVERSRGGRGHVNYRSSRLTWLLKPALEGDAKTLMFVNVSPALASASESKASMEFAAKVNSTALAKAAPSSKAATGGEAPAAGKPSGAPGAKRPASARPASAKAAPSRPASAKPASRPASRGGRGGWN